MKAIFFFDSMLTPKIITFIYWIMLLSSLVLGISTMFARYNGGFLSGLGIMIGGAIGSRIWCELLIVLFKIHDNLQKIANKSE
jgi:xanthine/uracil permease